MIKTVCDICGYDSTFHCSLPYFKEYKAKGGQPEVTLAKFTRLELVDFDLCSVHVSMLTDFIQLVEENINVY